MGFDFGAFVGGFGKQVAYDLDQARQQRYKMELIGEEEATRERLRKSREREERKQQLQDATDQLAALIGREGATWAAKNYSYGELSVALDRLKKYDGDTLTAFKMPEIPDSDKFGTNITKPKSLPPLLSTLTFKKEEENLASTSAEWIITHNAKVMEIKRDPNLEQDQKDEQLKLLEEDKKNYFNIHKQFEQAKRKEDETKPVDPFAQQKLDTFYDSTAQRNMLSSFQEQAFGDITGMVGKVEDYLADFRGTNTTAFANFRGANAALEFNRLGYNDKYFTTYLESQAKGSESALKNYAQNIAKGVAAKVDEMNKEGSTITDLTFSDTDKKPAGILDRAVFESMAQREALTPQGVYLVKEKIGEQFVIRVVTYLGVKNEFDVMERNYLDHNIPFAVSENEYNQFLLD